MVQSNLVELLSAGTKLEEAETLGLDLAAFVRSLDDPDPMALCRAYGALGGIQTRRGRLDAAEGSFELALEASQALEKPANVQAGIHQKLGDLFGSRNDSAAAIDHYRQSAELYTQVFGELHPFPAIVLVMLGEALRHAGQLEEAERVLREAFATLLEVNGARHPDTAWAEWTLGRTLIQRGALEEAERHLRASSVILVPDGGGGREDHAVFLRYDLGICLTRRGQHAEAVPLLEWALPRLANHGPPGLARVETCRAALEESRLAVGETTPR
jgi:tetratricopeptide (TPR) repeat protein